MARAKTTLAEKLTITGITVVSMISMVFLGYVLEETFGGIKSSPLVAGEKPGQSISQQANAGVASEISGFDAPDTPSPTPDNGLPFIKGFNPDMSLERISVWWDDNEKGGRSSTDIYLRTAVRAMCRLESELEEFEPPADAIPLKLKTTYNGDNEQEITVFSGNVAEFKGMEGRYFTIPNLKLLADGMLAMRDGEPEMNPQSQMEASSILAFYTMSGNRVLLDTEAVSAIAEAYGAIDKQAAEKPAGDLPKRTSALVFYYYGMKNYVDIYETGLMRFNSNNTYDVWQTAPRDVLNTFEELLTE